MSALRKGPVRVLIVDDSAMVRKILSIGLAKDPRSKSSVKPPTLTVPRPIGRIGARRHHARRRDAENGRVTFLKRFMPVMPTPTVIISSLTRRQAREPRSARSRRRRCGGKPVLGLVDGLPLMLDDICRRVKAAANADVSRFARRGATSTIEPVSSSLEETTDRVIAIGASTGGVEALARIMPAFPADGPGVVIVQHMRWASPPASRRGSIEPAKCAPRRPNRATALCRAEFCSLPAARHMSVQRSGGEYRIALKEAPRSITRAGSRCAVPLGCSGGWSKRAAALLTAWAGTERRFAGDPPAAGEPTPRRSQLSGVWHARRAQRLAGPRRCAIGEIPALLVRL